jgi:DNA-binding transcriptional regulator YiaG
MTNEMMKNILLEVAKIEKDPNKVVTLEIATVNQNQNVKQEIIAIHGKGFSMRKEARSYNPLCEIVESTLIEAMIMLERTIRPKEESDASVIKAAREANGLDQLQAANILGITKQQLSTSEIGNRIPSEKNMIKIAEKLKFPVTYFNI